ncbi:MAG: GxxExxY protein [Actinomycetota bacterium]
MNEPRINANGEQRKHWDLCRDIVRVFYEVYNELGYGFLEAVYEEALSRALRDGGFKVDRQVPTPIWFRGSVIREYKADLLVNRAVLLELKAAQGIDPSHKAQILNYLRATEFEVGLLLNFGPKPQFHRFIFENNRKGLRGDSRSFAAKQ